jgi:hypothetical protein
VWGCEIVLIARPIRAIQGDRNMPATVSLYLIGVWFCVGFFTGAGWAIAHWLIGRVLSRI